METYLTVKEVALLLQLSVPTIRRYTMNKEIPFHKTTRAVRYKKSEIVSWFEKREDFKAASKSENVESGLFGDNEGNEEGAKIDGL
jgi:excisionase family DNA binding protein